MVNIILIGIIGIVVGTSIRYIVKEKKKGVRCIGCPDSGSCGGSCSCGSDLKQKIE